MYKAVHNLVAVPITYHQPRSPRYMECVRFITYHCRVNVYQHSFFQRTDVVMTLYCGISYHYPQ